MIKNTLKLYNSYTNTKEDFLPIDAQHIKMYVCGPTVYNEIHVGNARSILVFDLLYRILRRLYPNVTYVRNITDIDDKIIHRAQVENKTSQEVAQFWEERFKVNYKKLNILEPNFQPRATDTIKEIIEAVGTLIENGFAYVNDDTVFFKVSELEEYGKLSKQDQVLDGARVAISESKEDQKDFVLWKSSKAGEPYWNSPWGKGRPGWHIECTAMSAKFLGERFDIHGGGQDLIFPHHENEQAQNVGLYGKFAGPRYWVHNAMIVMDGQKMSKSLGNIVLLADALENYDSALLRFFILGTHYRHKLIWNDENIAQFATRFTRIVFQLEEYLYIDIKKQTENLESKEIVEEIFHALLNDLNTLDAFTIFEEKLSAAIATDDKSMMEKLANTLHFLGFTFEKDIQLIEKLEQKLVARNQARQEKNYALADEIRAEINANGYDIADCATGSKLKRIF